MLHHRGEELEEQVGPFRRRDQEQLAARGARLVDRLLREGRREEHVVQRHRAVPAFALPLPRREEGVGARVGDDHPAFGVGEEDGVRRGVDDVQQQLALALQPVLVLGVGGRRAQAGDLLPEQLRRPGCLRLAARRAHQQQPLPGLPLFRERQRNGEEVAPPGVLAAPVPPGALPQRHRIAAREGEDEGMVRLPQRKMQGFELPLGDAARRHVLQGPRVALDQRADRLARSASIRQPIVAEEQDFGQRQTRCRRRFAGRFRPDPVLRGHGRAHLSTRRACGAAHRWRSRRSAPSGMRSRPAALRASCCRFPWGSWPEPGRPLRSI